MMNRNPVYWMVIALTIGFNTGTGVQKGSTVSNIALGVEDLLLILFVLWAMYGYYRDQKREQEENEAFDRLREEMQPTIDAITSALGGPGRVRRAAARQKRPEAESFFNTLSGLPATEAVKDKAFDEFMDQGGSTVTWDGMGEPARESWYRDVEVEADKECSLKNTAAGFGAPVEEDEPINKDTPPFEPFKADEDDPTGGAIQGES